MSALRKRSEKIENPPLAMRTWAHVAQKNVSDYVMRLVHVISIKVLPYSVPRTSSPATPLT